MAEQVGEQQLNENMEKIEKNTQETVENGGVEENNRTAELLNGLKITEQEDNTEKEDEELDSEAAKEKDDEYGSVNGRGNEEKKIFCGGISYDTTQEDLAHYFGQFGPVKEAQVKYDRLTGRSRGFAFVEFETVGGCKASLELREQTIKGKQCEIKPAKTREIGYMNKKVFVGGLPGDFPEEELRKHFEQYGRVEDVEWPFDKQSKARKNFAFVVFEAEEAADLAAASPKQQFANRECDVKKAVPQNKRSGLFSRPPLGGLRAGSGAYGGNPMLGGGGGGMRGGGPNALGSHQQMAQMYQNPAAWYQMNATAAWYNAAYNGGAWYGAPGATGGTSNNASAAQWYNSIGNNPAAAAAQASQWYGGNWYNNNGNVAASTNGNGTASGDINGTS